jgi:branched-chain amino acid transport system substrate-binding protein
MKRLLSVTLACVVLGGAASAETISVGVVGPFSGPNALQGRNFEAGIDAWISLNGNKVGGNEIAVVYRDLPAADAEKAKAIVGELLQREKVRYLAGFSFGPEVRAVSPMLQQADVPMVIMNAPESDIVITSPYVVRTSFTTWQVAAPMASAAKSEGINRVITLVSDDRAGADAENAFRTTFEHEGGKVIEAIRMPHSAVDLHSLMERIKGSDAEALFASVSPGFPKRAFLEAYRDAGLAAAGIGLFATGDLTEETDLADLADLAAGVATTYPYSRSHGSPENRAFVAAAARAMENPDELSFPAVGAYDGMYVIAKMIEATGGRQNANSAVEAVKGLTWTSPRGPVSIDPDSRSIVQTIYLREVVKEGDRYINKEVRSFEEQGDPGLAHIER